MAGFTAKPEPYALRAIRDACVVLAGQIEDGMDADVYQDRLSKAARRAFPPLNGDGARDPDGVVVSRQRYMELAEHVIHWCMQESDAAEVATTGPAGAERSVVRKNGGINQLKLELALAKYADHIGHIGEMDAAYYLRHNDT
jgi:hypothetical protein